MGNYYYIFVSYVVEELEDPFGFKINSIKEDVLNLYLEPKDFEYIVANVKDRISIDSFGQIQTWDIHIISLNILKF